MSRLMSRRKKMSRDELVKRWRLGRIHKDSSTQFKETRLRTREKPLDTNRARLFRPATVPTRRHITIASSGAPSEMVTVSFSGSVADVAVMKFRRFKGVVPGGKSYPFDRTYVRS